MKATDARMLFSGWQFEETFENTVEKSNGQVIHVFPQFKRTIRLMIALFVFIGILSAVRQSESSMSYCVLCIQRVQSIHTHCTCSLFHLCIVNPDSTCSSKT